MAKKHQIGISNSGTRRKAERGWRRQYKQFLENNVASLSRKGNKLKSQFRKRKKESQKSQKYLQKQRPKKLGTWEDIWPRES